MKKKIRVWKRNKLWKRTTLWKRNLFCVKVRSVFPVAKYVLMYLFVFVSKYVSFFFKCISFSNWQYIHTKLVLLSLWYLIPLIFFNVDNLVKHFLENCIVFLKHFLWQCCSGYENQRGRISKKFWWVFIIEFWYSS